MAAVVRFHHLYSLLQDKHLNEEGCRASSLRRQQHQQAPMTSPQVAATPPVYPKDAAVQAIRRFAMKPPYAEFTVSQPKPYRVISMTTPLNVMMFVCAGVERRSRNKAHSIDICLDSAQHWTLLGAGTQVGFPLHLTALKSLNLLRL